MNKDTYCIKPFIHIATERNGEYYACCLSANATGHNLATDNVVDVWNSDFYKELRHDLVNGVKNPNCERCWLTESKGFISRRQISNEEYGTALTEPLPAPVELDIKTGNVCNLKCITCNQLASSQHEKEVVLWKKQNVKIPLWLEEVEMNNSAYDITDVSNVGVNLDASLKTGTILGLQGGEPFASPLTIKLIDYCIEKGYNKNLMVSATTNLSSVTTKIIDRLTSFHGSGIGISYDHVDPEKFHFIRYPADYDHLVKNLNTVINERDIGWGISFTLSIFNALDLDTIFDKFIELSSQRNFKFLAGHLVLAPNYFDVEYLEIEQKRKMLASIERFLNGNHALVDQQEFINRYRNIHKIVETIPDDFEEVVKERTRVLDLYDKTRGTDYRKLFPYIKRYE